MTVKECQKHTCWVKFSLNSELVVLGI